MHRIVLFALLYFFAAAASAQSLDTMRRAQELGGLLASEELCGLIFDAGAIRAWIDTNVEPAQMGFSSMLATMTAGAKFQYADMTPSARAAHCRAVERSARHIGFID